MSRAEGAIEKAFHWETSEAKGGRVPSDVSRAEIVSLLDAFLSGTQAVELRVRIKELEGLPDWYRAHVEHAQELGRVWTAWSTDEGHVIAWGDYDHEQSTRVRAHVLFIEWGLPPADHHASWWYCYPKRPKEWICGRGRDWAPRA
jgi:hypothetical protein